MPDLTRNGMQCNEFDSLLSDALDGILSGPALDRFQAHANACDTCRPLFVDAMAGRTWLKGLTEVEPPASMVANILASTTGVDTQRLWTPARSPQPRISWWEQVQVSFLEPVWAVIRQPRFAMSFGMAFFAISVTLTAVGIKPGDVATLIEHPATIRHTYYNTQARVIRYFDNSRSVLELNAMVRAIKRTPPAEPGPAQPKERKNDTTQQPEQKQERNYSQTGNQLILAGDPLGPSVNDLPVVSVTTYRRFV